MRPDLFVIPFINYPVKSYGFMLMLGFLSAIYLASRRAARVRADPDVVINLGFCALFGGVVGARIMYVLHYWHRDFSDKANPLFAALDFTRGGMEFLGGFIGAVVLMLGYLLMRRDSIRLYFDILIPGLMWGLAFGRIGCFLNGCCFGGACAATPAAAWGVSFPYHSPAHARQFERLQVKVPAELTYRGYLLSAKDVMLSDAERRRDRRKYETAKQQFDDLAANPKTTDASRTAAEKQLAALKQRADAEAKTYMLIEQKLAAHPSHEFPGQHMTGSELTALARAHRSLPVHPAQLYASINALLASVFLAWVFRVRRRHGVVFAVWLMTYPWTRIILERIRDDNPKDTYGLTISQFISLLMVAIGVAMFLALRKMPEQSPAARAWEPPPESGAVPTA